MFYICALLRFSEIKSYLCYSDYLLALRNITFLKSAILKEINLLCLTILLFNSSIESDINKSISNSRRFSFVISVKSLEYILLQLWVK